MNIFFILRKLISRRQLGLNVLVTVMLLQITLAHAAETITIGRNSGVVWEGMPYSVSMNGTMGDAWLQPVAGMLAISSDSRACMSSQINKNYTTIAGYPVLQIATGLGLVPRAVGLAQYYRADGFQEQLSGTIGLPETKGQVTQSTSGLRLTVRPPTGTPFGTVWWCLAPRDNNSLDTKFYHLVYQRWFWITGTWVLIADGTQTNQTIKLPAMYASSLSNNPQYSLYQNILPSDISLRISTLFCSVDTNTTIDFGTVPRDTAVNAQLAMVTAPITVMCSQNTTSGINANINVQFRAAVDTFNSATPTRLPFATSSGGYVSGELSGVTGSGECGRDSGITFDNSQIKIASITAAEQNKGYNGTLVWRLCSAGATLPSGLVNTSAEMIVTFN